ncbi:putative MDR permease [Lentilactobacillus kosonis]|uniref:Putative MDR permease n=1 Tax=Lentilactobacillus kosonis TaxID=2810561 RepID=A0A401FLE8_9LACO|nr:hypothetical protein [Lentilactobacillus kosonis]GAY73167.1 putative MDR permease [Lentilactobacillus kosonis]
MIDKIGARIVIFAGFALMFAGYVTFSLIDPNYYSQVLIACLLLGSGFGIIAGPVVMLGAADFTGELLTASQSVIGVFRQIGSVLAVAIFVSSLSGNLVTAQTRIINNSNQYIAQTNLPNSTKAKVRQQVESKAHQGSNKSATKQTGISTNQKDQIIESQYHKIISSQNHQLSSVMKAKIHAQVTDTVSHEFNRQNNIVHRIIRHVKLTSKHELTHAFIRPYQIAVPFVGLSSLVSLLFYKRKSR